LLGLVWDYAYDRAAKKFDLKELALEGELPRAHRCYNVAGADLVTLEGLARAAVAEAGGGRVVPARSARVRDQTMSIERIRRELGFTPCTTAQGLAATAASLRQKGT